MLIRIYRCFDQCFLSSISLGPRYGTTSFCYEQVVPSSIHSQTHSEYIIQSHGENSEPVTVGLKLFHFLSRQPLVLPVGKILTGKLRTWVMSTTCFYSVSASWECSGDPEVVGLCKSPTWVALPLAAQNLTRKTQKISAL